MTGTLTPDLCVIGAGSGGLVVASGAAQLGASVVLVERGLMGGDCLNYGCVPSKALLAAAKRAHAVASAAAFGVGAAAPQIDFARVLAHVREVIEGIAPHDSMARFERLGVMVLRAEARFTGPREVEAGNTRIRARRFVIAAGSSPAVPDLPGLDSIPFLTNETLFKPRERPSHLIILGGGPVGIEMAQAHARLGSRVTVVQRHAILPGEDPELVEMLRCRLMADGVMLRENTAAAEVAPAPGGGVLMTLGDGTLVDGSDLLVAVGRRPNIDGMGLDRAEVAHRPAGIAIDRRMRTSNRRIYAIGDIAEGPNFTHLANHQAGIVIRNALFRLPAKADPGSCPRVTYTEPELAQVGLTEGEAREAHSGISVLRFPWTGSDRARAERETDGLTKIVTTRSGRVLGASIFGRQAGDLLLPWILAVRDREKVSRFAGLIAPYPTYGEITKQVSGSFFTPKLFSPRMRRLVQLLQHFG